MYIYLLTYLLTPNATWSRLPAMFLPWSMCHLSTEFMWKPAEQFLRNPANKQIN